MHLVTIITHWTSSLSTRLKKNLRTDKQLYIFTQERTMSIINDKRERVRSLKRLDSPSLTKSGPQYRSMSFSPSPPPSEARILCDKLFENIQLLIQYIDIPNLSAFILAQKLITAEEYKKIMSMWSNRHIQEAIVELLLTIKHKPDWGRKLFAALEDSVMQHSEGQVHLGHVYILKQLEKKDGKLVFADGLEKVTSDLESLLQSVDVYSSMRTESTLGLITVYLPLLIRFMDIDIVIPFLKGMRMLTDEDYQQVKRLWQSGHQRDAIENLLFILSRKCPEWEDCFVSALHQSIHSEYGDYHDGHRHILETLFNSSTNMDQGERVHRACSCSCHSRDPLSSLSPEPTDAAVYPAGEIVKVTHQATVEFRQTASNTIKGLYHNLDKSLKTLESSHSVHVSWMREMSKQIGTLSKLSSDLTKKCQHKRLQQGLQKSLGQLEIGGSAFESQIDRHERTYAKEIEQSGNRSFTLNPSRIEYKEMQEMLNNLDDYLTELIEWTDTAFATIYPHDDMVLIDEWGP